MMDTPIFALNLPVRRRAAARWFALSALLPMLGSCVTQPTLPDPATLMAPTKEIIVMEGHLDAPHQVLGSVQAVVGGPHQVNVPQAVDATKQHLRSAAYTQYGERVDAIIEVRTNPVTSRGLFGGWFRRTRGLQAQGVAVSVSVLPADSTDQQSLQDAAGAATSAIVSQLLKLPSFLGSVDTHGVVIDPMLEAPSGQQTMATYLLEQQVADRLRSVGRLQVLPFQLS